MYGLDTFIRRASSVCAPLLLHPQQNLPQKRRSYFIDIHWEK